MTSAAIRGLLMQYPIPRRGQTRGGPVILRPRVPIKSVATLPRSAELDLEIELQRKLHDPGTDYRLRSRIHAE
jgi:hypothetical protein